MRKLKSIGLIIFLFAIDQFTKYLAVEYLMNKEPIVIIKNIFQLVYVENTGVAYGLFQNKSMIFAFLNLVILVGIFCFYRLLPDEKRYKPIKVLLLFISAGALGNCCDRIIKGYVVDFFYFELIDFPVFNVADCCVTVSAVLLMILFLFYYKDEDFNLFNKKKANNLNTNEDNNKDN